MNRKLLLVVFVILLLVCAVSCDSGAELVFDAGNLDDKWVGVSRRSRITIENMDNTVMYAVKTHGSSRRLSRGAVDSSNIFKGTEDTYIPIPGRDNRASFTANEIDIQGNGSIQIIRLRAGTDDLTIKESEDPVSFYDDDGSAVYEEYYHIDFTQEPYSSLDRNRVALLTYGLGSGSGGSNWGYVTIDAGGIKPEGYTAGLYDFSEYDSINLYNTMTVAHSSSPWSQQLIITNPIPCENDRAQSLLSKLGVFSIGPMHNGADYVLEINKISGLSYSDNFNMRYVNGNFNGFAIPIYSDFFKDVYYIGKIEKELLADIWIYIGGYQGSDFGTVTFREATSEETTDYESHLFTIDSDEMVFNKRLDAKDYSEHKFVVKSKGGRILNNMYITVEYTYDDGTYIEGHCYTNLQSSHTYEVGYNNDGLSGSYIVFPESSRAVLENFSICVIDTEPVNVRITFKKSYSDVADDFWPTKACRLFVVPNNGQKITCERIKHYNYYTVPELKKLGYTFRGMYYQGDLYKAGDRIQIKNVNSAITAAWD